MNQASTGLQIYMAFCLAVLAYLIGSFSTGIAVSESNKVDIRSKGSMNPGATNVLRVMGTKWGIVTFVGDLLKTAAACGLSYLLMPGETFGIAKFGVLLSAFCVVVGHNWPVYYDFKGGKGVACSICAIAFIDLKLGLIAGAVAILIVVITRYISLASLSFLFLFTVLNLIFRSANPFQCGLAAILFLFSVYRHRANIGRLIKGTENKFGNRAK